MLIVKSVVVSCYGDKVFVKNRDNRVRKMIKVLDKTDDEDTACNLLFIKGNTGV